MKTSHTFYLHDAMEERLRNELAGSGRTVTTITAAALCMFFSATEDEQYSAIREAKEMKRGSGREAPCIPTRK